MASEIHALVLCIDEAFYIKHLIQEILARNRELHAFVDSKTVFSTIAKDRQSNERRLQKRIIALPE